MFQSQLLIRSFILLLVASAFFSGCSPEPEQQVEAKQESIRKEPSPKRPGCLGCHPKELDAAHSFGCTECHNGVDGLPSKEESHRNLLSQPAHPEHMAQTCGKCHKEQVESTAHSLHFTLKNELNLVRKAFGATEELQSLTEIPKAESPETVLELADDMLRRRCLRCHVYYTGDRYPGIVRGAGCASCHLSIYEGKLTSHSFLKTPGDRQCLQCHYGNRVGADYYGRFEHDMNEEYRTPYTTTGDYFRPFGMEYHQLQEDIHKTKGLVCVDCHIGSQLMGSSPSTIQCASCHDPNLLADSLPPNVFAGEAGTYYFKSHSSETRQPLPLMQHPAHRQYNTVATCQVCHAQWSFIDQQTSLLRRDSDEYDDFSRLTVQGSFEVEKILLNNLDYDAEEMEPMMLDKISGDLELGLWHKGFLTRRWEEVVVGRDESGKLQVMRPILDLHLSWIDEDEEVQFDSVTTSTKNKGWLPYIPHTTGKAGLFYRDRIEHFLRLEKAAEK